MARNKQLSSSDIFYWHIPSRADVVSLLHLIRNINSSGTRFRLQPYLSPSGSVSSDSSYSSVSIYPQNLFGDILETRDSIISNALHKCNKDKTRRMNETIEMFFATKPRNSNMYNMP